MTETTLLFDAALLQPYLGGSGASAWLLLTPNRLLASRIRSAVAAQCGAVAAAAPVLALNDWLEQLWQQLQFRGDALAENARGDAGLWVLSAAQELCLWEEAVRAGDMPLLRPAQAAEQAATAYRTLAQWRQLPLSAELRAEFEHNPDSRAFVEWLDRFEASCAARNCINTAARDDRVARAVAEGRLALPARVLGIGFDDMPPLQHGILQWVEEFRELVFPKRQIDAVCIGVNTLEEQLQAAALWVEQQLEAAPHGPFAIVVPDLAQQRVLVERVLLEVLTPRQLLPDMQRQLPPLNFSAGEVLAQTPPVRAALQLLELLQPTIERETLLELLQSPFCRFDDSSDAMSPDNGCSENIVAAIAALCDLRSRQIGIAQLRQIAADIAQAANTDESADENAADENGGWIFARNLQRLAEYGRRQRLRSARYSAARWAEIFAEALDIIGWPGARTLDSIEYQQHEHWQQALLAFAHYDQIFDKSDQVVDKSGGALDLNAALQRLRQLLQHSLFQAQTDDAPIQVLGVLEAAGLQFKGLWLCDMGDDRWPNAAAPHPLIPRDLQRRLRMPRCDAQREFEIAARLSRSLLWNAEKIVVSYQREREEVARAPSPLFAHLPQLELADYLGAELFAALPLWRWQQQQRAAFSLESFAAGSAPPLSDNERARGGSALFKAQADCPFQAFAKLRLRAQPLAEPAAGLDAAERGTLLHGALEWLWTELKDSAALAALSAQRQQALCERAAAQALRLLQDNAQIGARFAAIEQQRLAKLLFAWLEVERQRADFAVLYTEQKKSLTFARLQLHLRVDRIDRLADGRLLLIDYKSKLANSSAAEWLGERPDEPQLPLYSILWEDSLYDAASNAASGAGAAAIQDDLFAGAAADEKNNSLVASGSNEIAAIAFAQVRLEKPRLVGIGDDQTELHSLQAASTLSDNGNARNWAELKRHWRQVLENIAAEFIRGEAAVDPKTAKVCNYCALASVCRIAHQSAEDNDDAALDMANRDDA